MKQPILAHLSASAKLIFAFLLMIVCYIVLTVAGALVAIPLFGQNMFSGAGFSLEMIDPSVAPFLKFLQVIQSVSMFLLPALLCGIFFGRDPGAYLQLNRFSAFPFYLAALLILFVFLPFISWIASLNEMMKLPAFLGGLEQWMKESEENLAKLSESFLNVNTLGGLAVNLFVMAVIPGIAEELFFRGLLQRLFSEWFRNVHLGILVASILFSAIHFQFYGFFPRMILGMIFGYLLVRTGSLWIPVFAHMLNNSAAVIIAFLIHRGTLSAQYEEFGTSDNVFLIAGSVFFTMGVLYLVYRIKD